jgi:hypothetical protein
MKRLRNTSRIPDALVRQAVEFVAAELGISNFDIECRSVYYGTIAGAAYSKGSSYHTSSRPFAVLRVGTEKVMHWEQEVEESGTVYQYHGTRRRHLPNPKEGVRVFQARFPATVAPYQYAHHKNKKYVLADRTEALVYIAAHELRHLWQAAQHSDKRRSANLPRFHGSRGKFSEIDTESYAIHTLRRWRRANHD